MNRLSPTVRCAWTNVVELLRWRATQQPDRVAYTFLVNGGPRAVDLTYRELDRQARAIAVDLESRTSPGARALLVYPAGLDFIAAFFGCLYAGVIAVPAFPPESGRAKRILPRLRAIVNDSNPAVALTQAALLPALDMFLAGSNIVSIPHRIATDRLDASEEAEWKPPGLVGEALAFLQYTSGSTASPRGVMVSHANLLAHAEMLRNALGLTEQSIISVLAAALSRHGPHWKRVRDTLCRWPMHRDVPRSVFATAGALASSHYGLSGNNQRRAGFCL